MEEADGITVGSGNNLPDPAYNGINLSYIYVYMHTSRYITGKDTACFSRVKY